MVLLAPGLNGGMTVNRFLKMKALGSQEFTHAGAIAGGRMQATAS
jgi:hypothetical protein